MIRDFVQYSLQVREKFMTGKSQNSKAVFPKECVAFPVFGFFLFLKMLTAIQFDEQFRFYAEKINNVRTKGNLTTKMRSYSIRTQTPPQQFFDGGHLPAQLTRPVDTGFGVSEIVLLFGHSVPSNPLRKNKGQNIKRKREDRNDEK